jgi:hypothetical protein
LFVPCSFIKLFLVPPLLAANECQHLAILNGGHCQKKLKLIL